MDKNPLSGRPMSEAVVEAAAGWARALVSREARGPGDLDNAMRRVEARYGVPYSVLWRLRYRRPRDILASIYLRLKAAHEAECERQIRLLEHELAITRATAGADAPAVVAAQAVVDAARNALKGGGE